MAREDASDDAASSRSPSPSGGDSSAGSTTPTHDWTSERPVLGATALCLGSLIVLWRIGAAVGAVPGHLTPVGWAGVAAPIVGFGSAALALGRPNRSTVGGFVGGGTVLAAVSGLLVSALPLARPMVLFAGLFTAGVGAVLCIGWSPAKRPLIVAEHVPALQAGASTAVAVLVVAVVLSSAPASAGFAAQTGNTTTTTAPTTTTTLAPTTTTTLAPTTTTTLAPTTTTSTETVVPTTQSSTTTSAPTTTTQSGTTTPSGSTGGNQTGTSGGTSGSTGGTTQPYFPAQNDSLGGFVVHQGTLEAGTYDYQAHCPAPATGLAGEPCLDISVDSTATADVGSRTARQRLGDTAFAPVEIDDFLIYKDFYYAAEDQYVHFELRAEEAVAQTDQAPGSPSAVDVYISEFRSEELTARLDLIQDPIFDGIPADHIAYWTCAPGNESGFGSINDIRVGLDVSPRLTGGEDVSLNAHTLGSTKTRLSEFELSVERGRHEPIDVSTGPSEATGGCA